MSNLFDMRCPQCGDEDHIDIDATVQVRVCDDGTHSDDSRWFHYDKQSSARCAACGFQGIVGEFDPE